MTLAVGGTIALSNVVGIDNVPGSSEICVAYTSGSNTIVAVYSLSSYAIVGTATTITGVSTIGSLVMLSSTVALCITTGSTTSYLVNISTNTVTNVTGSSYIDYSYSGASNQQSASLQSNVGYFVIPTTGSLMQINSTTNVATSFTLTGFPGEALSCIIAINISSGTPGYIIGTERGRIVQTDSSLNIVKSYQIPARLKLLNYGQPNDSVSIYGQVPISMNYYAGYLAVTTSWGQIILFDNDTGIELQRVSTIAATGNNQGPVICNSGFQEFLLGGGYYSSNTGAAVSEWDMIRTPMAQVGQVFGDTSDEGFVKLLGINTNSTPIGWCFVGNSTKIYVFTMSGVRTIALHTINTNSVPGEFQVIEDDGVGSTNVMFHGVTPAAGKMVPLTASKNVMVSGWTGNGVNQGAKFGRYTS
jgi:hypothetical protein